MRQVGTEHGHGVAVRAQRAQADRFLTAAALRQKLLDIHGAPVPRELAGELLEPAHQT
ncbi:hypothetical protein ACFFX0_31210 [Citricoccus parietis]|uniref:Uncharacterized protein n=1 Tax=Citricoccus parietis TaxID=592307 RepID=A0ABV5G8X5_9MICC